MRDQVRKLIAASGISLKLEHEEANSNSVRLSVHRDEEISSWSLHEYMIVQTWEYQALF
jgi:hypothetical protein